MNQLFVFLRCLYERWSAVRQENREFMFRPQNGHPKYVELSGVGHPTWWCCSVSFIPQDDSRNLDIEQLTNTSGVPEFLRRRMYLDHCKLHCWRKTDNFSMLMQGFLIMFDIWLHLILLRTSRRDDLQNNPSFMISSTSYEDVPQRSSIGNGGIGFRF